MSETKNRGGRPRVDATPITVRLPPDLLHKLDTIRARRVPPPSRQEAVREMIEATFDAMEPKENRG